MNRKIEKEHWQILQVNQIPKLRGNNSRKQIVLYAPENIRQ
jgi:hypothetical protein